MNKEQAEAINRVKDIINSFYFFPNPQKIEFTDKDVSSLEIVLHFVEQLYNTKKQEEHIDYKRECEVLALQLHLLREETNTIKHENKMLQDYYKEQNEVNAKFVPVSCIKEMLNKEEIPLVIIGGKRNSKTLNYGIKLGRKQVLEEILNTYNKPINKQ